MSKIRTVFLLAFSLLALSGCIVEEGGWGGYHHHWHEWHEGWR